MAVLAVWPRLETVSQDDDGDAEGGERNHGLNQAETRHDVGDLDQYVAGQ